jgi:hypothetical protein
MMSAFFRYLLAFVVFVPAFDIAPAATVTVEGGEEAGDHAAEIYRREARERELEWKRERERNRLTGGLVDIKLSSSKSCVTFTSNCTYTNTYEVQCRHGGFSLVEHWDYWHSRLLGWQAFGTRRDTIYYIQNGYRSAQHVAEIVCSGG